MDIFTDLVCRPPRYTYDLESELGPSYFKIDDLLVQRKDLQVRNERKLLLQCSHYVPVNAEEYSAVVYCHGNAGSRRDADDIVNLLLPLGISVFTFDFSGSGMSEGELCSLGFHERGDLQCIIRSLVQNPRVTRIGVWGRSMGAATALMVAGDEELKVDALVLDSCFLSLESVASEIASKYIRKIPFLESWLNMGGEDGRSGVVPFLEEGIQMLRAGVLARCAWDIKAVNPEAACASCRVPALFLHAEGDTLVLPRHSRELFERYAHAEKRLEVFEGDHNSVRPDKVLAQACTFLSAKLARADEEEEGGKEEEREGGGGSVEELGNNHSSSSSNSNINASTNCSRNNNNIQEEELSDAARLEQTRVVNDSFLITQILAAQQLPATPTPSDCPSVQLPGPPPFSFEEAVQQPSPLEDSDIPTRGRPAILLRATAEEREEGGGETGDGGHGGEQEWRVVEARKAPALTVSDNRWWPKSVMGTGFTAVAGVAGVAVPLLRLTSLWRR